MSICVFLRFVKKTLAVVDLHVDPHSESNDEFSDEQSLSYSMSVGPSQRWKRPLRCNSSETRSFDEVSTDEVARARRRCHILVDYLELERSSKTNIV